jgi:hypothetical protein
MYVINVQPNRGKNMASEAQITANRRNAAKSTGPKTETGKAVVARSALKHGLTAQKIVCCDEKWQDFIASHDALREALEPADAIEEQLVERIALCAWRLRRASRVEAEMINAFLDSQPRFLDTQMATAFERAPTKMTMLSRYETALDNALRRALTALERRQAQRRGEAVLPPIEVHVDGLDVVDAVLPTEPKPENYETKPIYPEKSVPEILGAGG